MLKSPQEIIDIMYSNDAFSKLLGIQIKEISAGKCLLALTVKSNMLNGFGILHGGICFSLADTALAFASNAHGYKALTIDTNISYINKSKLNDELKTDVFEINRNKKIAIYNINIFNQDNLLIAVFKGTVSISDITW